MTTSYSHENVEQDFINVEKILNHNNDYLLAQLIDSTLLKPQLTEIQITQLVEEACQNSFRAVCIPPCYVVVANQKLATYKKVVPKLCTVIGFPNGYVTTKTKCFEVQEAITNGAEEIDFVQNITLVKSGNFTALAKEYAAIVEVSQKSVVKVILETSLLTESEIVQCTRLAAQNGIHIIKTSTGFGERGASLSDINTIRKTLDEHFQKTKIRLGIKASGGIRNKQDALSFLQAGATRLGTSQGMVLLSANNVNQHNAY